MMQLASIMLRHGGKSNTILPMHNVTPAEAILLQLVHDPVAGNAVTEIKVTGEAKIDPMGERNRLRDRYINGGKALAHAFPDQAGRDIPENFGDPICGNYNLHSQIRENAAPSKAQKRKAPAKKAAAKQTETAAAPEQPQAAPAPKFASFAAEGDGKAQV